MNDILQELPTSPQITLAGLTVTFLITNKSAQKRNTWKQPIVAIEKNSIYKLRSNQTSTQKQKTNKNRN